MSYDAFQVSGSSPVANPDLMGAGPGGGEIAGLVVHYRNDRLFVESVRRAFVEASGTSVGQVTVDQGVFDAAFARAVASVAREHGIDPAEILVRRAPVTVDDPVAAGIPQSSGFVNDPICTATGHLVEAEDDFVWPARLGALRWPRVYSSRFVAGGPFGRGWASWASVGVVRHADGTVGFQSVDGQLAIFAPEPAGLGFGRVSGISASLTVVPASNGGGGGWELEWDWSSAHPGEVWRFDAAGRLVEVSGAAVGETSFEWDGPRLVAVVHGSGRRLDVEWAGERIVAVRSSCGRVARYRYNESGDLVATERVLGDRTYVPDERGLIVEVVDADGVRLCRNTFDDEGRVLVQVSPFGRETVLRYLPGNRTVVADTGDGPVAVYEHDFAGRLTAVMDQDGHRMERSFDPEGRCVAATGFDGASTIRSFEADGTGAQTIGADGVPERWDYDDQGRVTDHRVEGGAAMTYGYDGDNPIPAHITGPDGWEMHLDVRDGLLRSVTDADGVTLRLDHDPDGNVVAMTNGLGAATRIEPHVSGQPARMTMADGASFTFDRDPAGRVRSMITPTGDVLHTEWTPAGRLAAVVEPTGGRMTFEAGSHGETQRITDALGGVTELQHDQLARLVGLAVPGGAKWGFEYSTLGLLSMATDPSGAVWSYDYDAEGRPTAATDPLGHTARWRYNPAGRLVEMLDRSGNATRYNHDALGRVVRTEGTEGAVTETDWDAFGRPTQVRFPDGETLTYAYTPAGRVASVETAEGRGWVNDYDPAGRLVAVTDAAGGVTRFEWDECDRMTAAISPAGRVARYGYDGCGRVTETERGGRTWRTGYDPAGRVVAMTDPMGSTTSYRYDLRGKLVAATDPLGNTVRIRYDERGNPTGLVDPFGGVVTTAYDAMRRPVATVDQLGRTSRVHRDDTGRVVRQESATGTVVEARHDARGLVTDVRVDGRDQIVYDRDRAGRPVAIHEPGRNRTMALTWSPGGRLRSLDVDGQLMRWDYDRDGQLTTRWDPAGRATRYTRDRRGGIAAVDIEGWGTLALGRDSDGRLAALDGPGIHRRWDHDAAGLVAGCRDEANGREVAYARDAAGRVVEARDGTSVSRYRYDQAGQLVAASRGADAWEWQYDPAGRIALEDGPGGTRRFTYDDAHQLVRIDGPDGAVTFAYDAAGRRTEQAGPGGGHRYTWDGLGRLTAVESHGRRHELDVDALGRLAAVDGTALTWDPTAPVAELMAVGDRRVVGVGGLTLGLAEADRGTDSDGGTDWLAGDGRGSTDRHDGRDPWGDAAGDASGVDLGYQGEIELDGLVWLRNRLYDPATRQFMSPDPLPGVPGLPTAANPYAYADNDPIGMVDPLGLQGQPLSIDQYNEIRAQETGWQWNNIVTVGLVVVGVALCFVPGIGLGGMMLIGAALGAAGGAAPGIIQGIQTGNWDTQAILGGALKGAVIGAAAGPIGRGLGALGSRFTPALMTAGTRGGAALSGGLVGAGTGAATGTLNELYDLTPLPGSDGQFDPEGILVTTVFGGGTGAGAGALTFRPPVTAPDTAAPPATPAPGTDLVRVPDFRSTSAAFQHYGKHVLGTEPLPNGQYRVNPRGADMPEYNSFGEYRNGARSFMSGDSPDGVMQGYRTNGDLLRVEPKTGEFGVRTPTGTIRTYFRPEGDPVQYFKDQF